MPSRPRWAFTAASFLSLCVCISTLGLWFHSTQHLDRIRSGSHTRRFTLHSKDGEIYFEVARAPFAMWKPGYQHIHALPTQYRPPPPSWEFAGFGAGAGEFTTPLGTVFWRYFQIPLWPIAVLSSILPMTWFDRRGRQRHPTLPSGDPSADLPVPKS